MLIYCYLLLVLWIVLSYALDLSLNVNCLVRFSLIILNSTIPFIFHRHNILLNFFVFFQAILLWFTSKIGFFGSQGTGSVSIVLFAWAWRYELGFSAPSKNVGCSSMYLKYQSWWDKGMKVSGACRPSSLTELTELVRSRLSEPQKIRQHQRKIQNVDFLPPYTSASI